MLDDNLRGTKILLAETFDNNSHIFYLVKNEDTYYLQYENIPKLITKLVIKPDLWAFYKDGGYEHGVHLLKPIITSKNKVLVMNYYIDPGIFHILVNQGLISYSKAMADLYQLPIAYSRDIKYHHADYKRSKNKELVLERMRNGLFN